MTVVARSVLAMLAAVSLAGAPAQEPESKPPPAKSILWARTWEGALREARVRNVPIYILVSIGEG
jgi:hypothetical protein